MEHFNNIIAPSAKVARLVLIQRFRGAPETRPIRWQGVSVEGRPEAKMRELINVSMHIPQVHSIPQLADDLQPWLNLPWADDHFEERVCGSPINPGVEWANWPDGQSAKRFLNEQGMFNHNYMERYWPKKTRFSFPSTTREEWEAEYNRRAGLDPTGDGDVTTWGIRLEYGDLKDLVDLLALDPGTRQAYLPIFFPEDTGIGDGGRKPCTLGYQFIVRDSRIHTYYPMRSCDFRRHWADDVYLTMKLTQWILDELKIRDSNWDQVSLGSFTMHCTNLHIFINDFLALES